MKRKRTTNTRSGKKSETFRVGFLDGHRDTDTTSTSQEQGAGLWVEDDNKLKRRHLNYQKEVQNMGVYEQTFAGNSKLEDVLKIKPPPIKKDDLKERPLMSKDVIPRAQTSVLIVGGTGSGKTTSLIYLLTHPDMFGGYFDRIILFAHTGLSDPNFEYLSKSQNMDKSKDVITNTDEMIDKLAQILQEQKLEVEKHDGDKSKAKKLCLIFEDLSSNIKLMNSEPFIRAFTANRHFGLNVFACTHKLRMMSRVCRLQAHNILFFAAPLSEQEILAQEHCPPDMSEKEFMGVIQHATKEPKSFLHINNKVPHATRYRKNFVTVLTLK